MKRLFILLFCMLLTLGCSYQEIYDTSLNTDWETVISDKIDAEVYTQITAKERICIKGVYFEFNEWESNPIPSTDWYTKPQLDKVVQ